MTESPLTIPALLARSAQDFGRDDYVVTPHGRITYEEAHRRSADIARALLRSGVGKGTRIGLFFANGVEWILWWLAASRIGAVVVPLSILYTAAEIAKVLRLADVALLVAPDQVLGVAVAKRFESALPELAGQPAGRLALRAAPYLRSVLLLGDCGPQWSTRWDDDPSAGVPPEVLAATEAEVTPADLAVMVHTS
nr:AMP-binding protein [Actinomycetota bacterium]